MGSELLLIGFLKAHILCMGSDWTEFCRSINSNMGHGCGRHKQKIQLNFNLLDTVSQSDKGHNDEICIAILQDELSSRLLDKKKINNNNYQEGYSVFFFKHQDLLFIVN